MKKCAKSIKRSIVFQIALKGGDNRNLAWEKFDIQCFCNAKNKIQQTMINLN